MGENKITRDVYKHYANRIVSVLKDEGFYQQFKKRVDKGSASFKLAKKRLIQDISIDWIDTIESILPNLDTIVRNPRKFIVQEEDIVDVSLARSISTESVKYLAQHTNMISKVDKNGDVTPSKILNITKEESFEIYENRFIYTLLLKLKDFVTMRYDKIKKASATQDVLELDVESRFNLPSKKITYRTEYFAQLSFDEVMRLDPDTLTKIERVAKIDRIITDFLSSSFAKSMRNSAPVRPPIMRTNVILKEPNFKKALVLWQFIETYQATGGFSTSDEVEDIPLEDESTSKLREMVTLNTMLFESMYDQCETDLDIEDKEFADFLRVGQMDFEKDKIDRDEYAQKLEDEIENEEEEENIEEVKPQEEENAEEEIPPEEQKEGEKPHEIETEVVVERPVEVERLKEMPPKADQEEVDLEPDAEKFDQHLFEVRKLYKRPDDDKLKQEDMVKVRDAIDRCLTSYRRIKQEELEDKERQARIRRRKEDIEKRAAAFRKQREELEKNGEIGDESVYFGIDPFSYQRAKIAQAKRDEEERQQTIKVDKNENLELDDSNTDEIGKSIDEMEKDRQRRALLDAQIEKELETIDGAILPINGIESDKESVENEKDEISANNTESDDKDAKNGSLISNSADKGKKKAGKIRIAKNEEIDPWADGPKQKKVVNLEPVDENKVAVGDIHVKDDGSVAPWGDNANLGKLDQPTAKKPRKKVQPDAEKEADELSGQMDTDSIKENENAETQNVERKKPKRDERGLSPTTLNQKYSTPSGKQRHFDAIDENKVAVGGIRFADGSNVDDPFGGAFGITANKAETGKIVVDKDETRDASANSDEKPSTDKKPRKPRAKKQKPSAEAQSDDKSDDVSADVQSGVADVSGSDKTIGYGGEILKGAQTDSKKENAPKKKKNTNGLSPTTLNQKYSTPSGKQRHFDAVDESKVAVGGIRFADGSNIDDPFGNAFGITANKAERQQSQDDSVEQTDTVTSENEADTE